MDARHWAGVDQEAMDGELPLLLVDYRSEPVPQGDAACWWEGNQLHSQDFPVCAAPRPQDPESFGPNSRFAAARQQARESQVELGVVYDANDGGSAESQVLSTAAAGDRAVAHALGREEAVTEARFHRQLYVAFLSLGVLALFAGAVWSMRGRPLPLVEWPVLAFVLLVVALLLWLRPRALPYALGLLCLALAFAGLWLTSPPVAQRLATESLFERIVLLRYGGSLGFLLPAAWVLLAASVAGWKRGLASYLLATLAFLLTGAVAGWFGIPGASTAPLWIFALLPFVWPLWTLAMLGLFGHTFG